MKRILRLFLIIFCLSICSSKTGAKDFELASRGKARYSISVSAEASLPEQYAASELAHWLNVMTDAGFTVNNGKTAGRTIFVGKASSDAFVQAGIPYLGDEESGIFVRGNNIFLGGACGRAVIYAVYDFLGKLGCTWCAPDFRFYEGRSSHVPRTETLRYSDTGDVRTAKTFKYRKFYVEEGLSHNLDNLRQLIDWMPKVGYNTLVVPIDYQGRGVVKWDNWRDDLIPELDKRDIIIEVGGHGYQNFLNAEMDGGRVYHEHPEWFGVDNKGNRSKEHRIVFCTSEPDAVSFLQNNILKYLKSHPEIDIFDFWPPDGDRWCLCDKCRKTSATDRHLALVSNTAEFLKKELPEVKLECLAYSRYVAPPENEKLDSSVLLDFCPIGQNFETQIYDEITEANKNYKKSLLEWKKVFPGEISIYTYFRKYIWQSLPNIIPHYMQNDLKFYEKVGADGVSVYSEPGDWFAYGPNYYVLAALAEDPDTDVDALMKEYSAIVFGDRADAALTVYDMLEKTVPFATRFPSSGYKTPEDYDRYAATVAETRKMLKSEISGCNDSVTKSHLERLDCMLGYVEISIAERKNEVITGKRLKGNMITEEVRKYFTENADKGIFIIRN